MAKDTAKPNEPVAPAPVDGSETNPFKAYGGDPAGTTDASAD